MSFTKISTKKEQPINAKLEKKTEKSLNEDEEGDTGGTN